MELTRQQFQKSKPDRSFIHEILSNHSLKLLSADVLIEHFKNKDASRITRCESKEPDETCTWENHVFQPSYQCFTLKIFDVFKA